MCMLSRERNIGFSGGERLIILQISFLIHKKIPILLILLLSLL